MPNSNMKRVFVADLKLLLDEKMFPCAFLVVCCPQCGICHDIAIAKFFCDGASPWCCPHCCSSHDFERKNIVDDIHSCYDKKMINVAEIVNMEGGADSTAIIEYLLMLAIALRPITLIRFVKIYNGPIGDYVLNAISYIKKRAYGSDVKSHDYVGLMHRDSPNSFLDEILDRSLKFSPIVRQLVDKMPSKVEAGSYNVPDSPNGHFPLYIFDNDPSYMEKNFSMPFTVNENEKAWDILQNNGVPRGSKIACLLVRDPGYYKKRYGIDASMSFRNIPLDNFRLACEYLARNGYYVLRMGKDMQEKLTWGNDHILDYSTVFRSEFMDIWLFANCDVCLSTSTGLDALPCALYRDLIRVDALPLGITYFHQSTLTTLWPTFFNPERLSLVEIFNSDIGMNWYLEQNIAKGLHIEYSSPLEILDTVEEYIEIKLLKQVDEEISCLQQGMCNLLYSLSERFKFGGNSVLPSVICTKFSRATLKKYENELRQWI